MLSPCCKRKLICSCCKTQLKYKPRTNRSPDTRQRNRAAYTRDRRAAEKRKLTVPQYRALGGAETAPSLAALCSCKGTGKLSRAWLKLAHKAEHGKFPRGGALPTFRACACAQGDRYRHGKPWAPTEAS